MASSTIGNLVNEFINSSPSTSNFGSNSPGNQFGQAGGGQGSFGGLGGGGPGGGGPPGGIGLGNGKLGDKETSDNVADQICE